MKKLLLLVLVVAAGAVAWWVYQKKTEPLRVSFTRARRETVVASVPTNGKVEPLEWQTMRSEAAGTVDKVPVQEGQHVEKGAVVATMVETGLHAEVQAAEARLAQARAELATIEAGGRRSELTEIENSLNRARYDRDVAQREYASLRRLAAKQAATAVDVEAARGKLREAELKIEALERRKAALVTGTDRTVAEARLRDAEAALELARTRVAQTVIRAPIAGVIYGLAVRPGSYLEAGGEVANVGIFGRVRVRVYVDEPELGRVARGEPVTITWDALPGKTWTGTVDKMPTSIQTLGSRNVGEVLCTIDNPGRELVPGTNVNAEIRTSVAGNAITIPKECLRRNAGGPGVLSLDGEKLVWHPVKTGIGSITRIQILEGVKDGDPVALPTDQPLQPGEKVTPVFQ